MKVLVTGGKKKGKIDRFWKNLLLLVVVTSLRMWKVVQYLRRNVYLCEG